MKTPLCLLLLLVIFCTTVHAQELLVHAGDKGLYLDHSVAAKEGLYSIGRLYNVNPKHIAAYNKLDFNKGLEIGQVIHVPLSDTNLNQKTTKGFPLYYIPQAGEGLMKVSNVNRKVSLQNLRTWNKLNGDNISVGQPLVIGYLVSPNFKPDLLAKKADAVVKELPPVATGSQDIAADRPATVVRQPEPVTAPTTEIAKPVPPQPETTTTAVIREQAEPKQAPLPVLDETRPSQGDGFFKTYYEQQIRSTPVSKNQTVTSGIFKTTSGWQDGKYYLLVDGVPSGTIVRISNPDNNKAVYAKVLGEMNGIRQNQGLGVRISNAAASTLGVKDTEKFIVKLAY